MLPSGGCLNSVEHCLVARDISADGFMVSTARRGERRQPPEQAQLLTPCRKVSEELIPPFVHRNLSYLVRDHVERGQVDQ